MPAVAECWLQQAGWASVLTVEVLLEDLLGVLLGLSRGVGVVQVGLVAADDLSFRSHVCGGNDLVRRWYLVELHWSFWCRVCNRGSLEVVEVEECRDGQQSGFCSGMS